MRGNDFGSHRPLLDVHVAVWLAIGLLVAPVATAQVPMEIDILEEYLAEHDRVSPTPHCLRHDGYFGMPGEHGTGTLAGGTNDILVQHKEWHQENGLGFDVSADPSDRTGDLFVAFHREFLAEYQTWRNETGHPPVVAWNPAEPQPAALAYPFPERACSEQNVDARVPMPTWLAIEGGDEADSLYGYQALCDFQDLNELGKAVRSSYHIEVHRTFGEITSQDPRDPWFWSFHAFLDGRFDAYETSCREPESDASPAADAPSETAPGVGIVGLAGLLALARVGVATRSQSRAAAPAPQPS